MRCDITVAFFLVDVAEAIDLNQVRGLLEPTREARFAPPPSIPLCVEYQQPPLSIDGDALSAPELAGFTVRFKVFVQNE